MKNNTKLVLVGIFLSIFLGLLSGQTHARRALLLSGNFNPEYADLRLEKIVVVAPNVVQSFRDQIEIRMIDALEDISDGGVNGIRFADVIPPFKQYTSKEVLDKLTSQQVTAAVIIDIQLAGGSYAEEDERRKASSIPQDMTGALGFSANYRPRPSRRGKYRGTTVTVYHLASGGVIWRGTGQVNANKDSVKWHKRSGRMLAKKLSRALKEAGVLMVKIEPVVQENTENVNFATGDEPEE